MAIEIPAALRTPGYQPHEIASTIIRNLKNSLSKEWRKVDVYTIGKGYTEIPSIVVDIGNIKHSGSSWYFNMDFSLFNCPNDIDAEKVMSLVEEDSLLSSILNLSVGGNFFSPASISKFVPSPRPRGKENFRVHGRIEIPGIKPESEVSAIDIPETMLPENNDRIYIGIAEDKTERYILKGEFEDEPHLLVTGNSGSGKTTLLCSIAKQVIDVSPTTRVIYSNMLLREPPKKLHEDAVFINGIDDLHSEISEIAKFFEEYKEKLKEEEKMSFLSSLNNDIKVNELYDDGVVLLLDNVWNSFEAIPRNGVTQDIADMKTKGREIFSWLWKIIASREEIPIAIALSEQKVDINMPVDYQNVIILGQISSTARFKILKDRMNLDYLYKTRRNDGTKFGERPGEGIFRNAKNKKIVPLRTYNI